jgi:carboxymethylenebutenolidase
MRAPRNYQYHRTTAHVVHEGDGMAREQVRIQTEDGECPASVFTPVDPDGPRPGVIFYMDGLGIRPALFDMAQRLADSGYVVLLPDLFYRAGPYEALDARELFASGRRRETLKLLMETTDNQRAARDTRAFLDQLFTRTDVSGNKIGATGYCMGGGIALTVAGTYPDQIAAAASFHGGSLATDAPTSPHRLADDIKGRIYIGAADNDSSYPPAMAARLIEALMDASVEHRHDLYAGAAHGWTMSDFPIYDSAAAERHWNELTGLLSSALG